MSIQNERVSLLTQAILKKNLQEGLLPDSKEFIWQLNQALRQTGENEPTFRFRSYANGDISSSAKVNHDNEKILLDLDTLYRNMKKVHLKLSQQSTGFQFEKERLEKKLDVLENRLRQFVTNSKRSGLLPYAYDTFDTTEKVDLVRSEHIFVDTQNNGVRLTEEKNQSRQVYPQTETRLQLYPENTIRKEETITGAFDNIYLDDPSLVWQKRVRTQAQGPLTGVLSLSFAQKTSLNRIELNMLTIRPLSLRVTFSPDGVTWYALPYAKEAFETSKQVALDFPSIDVKALRLHMEKSEADDQVAVQDGFHYQYLFGFEHIRFYAKQYATTGTLLSNELSLENSPQGYAVDSVSLHADAFTPTGTEIRYAIALPAEEPDWQYLSAAEDVNPAYPQKIYFGQLRRNEQQELFIPRDFSLKQSEAEDLMLNSIPLYRLSSLQNGKISLNLPAKNFLANSLKLYLAKKSWEILSFPTQEVSATPTLSDYQGVRDGMVYTYTDLGQSDNGELFRNKKDSQPKKYLAKTAFYMENNRTILATPIATEPISIYLNGELVFEGETNGKPVHYVLRSGWNELFVLVNGKNALSVNGMSVSVGFNPAKLSTKTYASSKSLTEISLFDLRYNTKINDRSVFAKRETSQGVEILINFGEPGLSFDLFYDYQDELEGHENALLFKAEFMRHSGESSTTPILRSYRIECS